MSLERKLLQSQLLDHHWLPLAFFTATTAALRRRNVNGVRKGSANVHVSEETHALHSHGGPDWPICRTSSCWSLSVWLSLPAATIATLHFLTLFLTPQFHNTAVIHILFQGCNKCLKPKKRISAEISKNSIASQNICSAKTPPWDIAQSSARAGHRGKLVIKLYPFELSCVPDVCPR